MTPRRPAAMLTGLTQQRTEAGPAAAKSLTSPAFLLMINTVIHQP